MAKSSIAAVLLVVHVCFVLGQQNATSLDMDNSTAANEAATTVKATEPSPPPTRLLQDAGKVSSTTPPLVHNALNATETSPNDQKKDGKSSANAAGPMVGFVLTLLCSAMF